MLMKNLCMIIMIMMILLKDIAKQRFEVFNFSATVLKS